MNDAEDSVDEPSTRSPPAPSFTIPCKRTNTLLASPKPSAEFQRDSPLLSGFRIRVTGCQSFGGKATCQNIGWAA